MDQERLNNLFYGQKHMDAALLTKLNYFKEFTEKNKPVITVLCTENRLRMKMDKLVYDHMRADFHVCGTYDGIEEALEKAIYSDAVIVNTLALKIAPVGLYEVLEELSKLNKEVYVILSGWESLPKTPELSKKKLLQLDESFPFSMISMCRNVFSKPLDGFYFIEDVLTEIEERCFATFQHQHSTQEETLYKMLRMDVSAFRKKIQLDIQGEQTRVYEMQQIILAKQRRYEIVFSHATVDVNDALDRFERSLTNISVDDTIYHLEEQNKCPAQEAFIKCSKKAEHTAKSLICKRICDAMDAYLEKGFTSLETQTQGQVNDAVNDLLSIAESLKQCRFIEENLLSELLEKTNDAKKLLHFANSYSHSIAFIFDKAKTELKPKIMAFQYEYHASDLALRALSGIKNLPKEDNDQADGQEKAEIVKAVIKHQGLDVEQNLPQGFMDRISGTGQAARDAITQMGQEVLEQSKDSLDQRRWNQFCSETQNLIDFSKNTLSSLLNDFSRLSNEEIEVQSKNTIHEYFGFITKQLDSIESALSKIAEEFGRSM